MKFLIEKINGKVIHDFSFTLLEAIKYNIWLGYEIKVKYIDYVQVEEPDCLIPFDTYHKSYTPIGSVEFVSAFLKYFYGFTPKPINVPKELFPFANRNIYNGNQDDLKGKMFVKSNTKIKDICEIYDSTYYQLPVGDYQYSDVISIDSEWRAFVHRNKLVGLQNYSGEFTMFPNVETINKMIDTYAPTAPIAYTLDVGINETGTFVIECHDFFSCGFYGFNNYGIIPHMFHQSFRELLIKNKK